MLVSSILSVPSGEGGQLLKPFPAQDYASLLSTPAPLLFSASLERALLNTLNNTGFDVGQMVHSVISNACDRPVPSGGEIFRLKGQRM